MNGSGPIIRHVAHLIVLVVVGAMLDRMRFGIDFTDEAFYVALPFRFALGDRPFIDELNVTQTGALLLYPFVKAYVSVKGGASGIFLFIRVLYVFFFGAVGWTTFTLASKLIPRPAALLLGAACVCFMPYGIPGLSYNTLSAGLLTIGLCLAVSGLLGKLPPPRIHRDTLFWAGVTHAAAALAYPSVVVATVPTAAAILALATGRRRGAVGRYALGGVAFAALSSPVLLQAGVSQLRHVVAYSSQAVSSDLNRAPMLLDAFLAQHPQLWRSIAIIAVAVIVVRRHPLLVGIALPAIPVLARGSVGAPIVANMNYLSCFALFGPLFFLGMNDRRVARVLLFCGWLPPLFAAAAMGWSSGNGVVASGLAMYAAAIFSALMFSIWLSDTAKRWTWTWLRAPVTLAPAVVTLELLRSVLGDDAFYREEPRKALTAKVTEGPYKGLFTSPRRKAWLASVTADIREHAKGERALFFYDFPAGYLIANKRPIVTSAWIFPFVQRSVDDARFFQERAASGELVMRLNGHHPPMPLDDQVKGRTRPIGQRDGYRLDVVR